MTTVGYVLPASTQALPRRLNLGQFIQTVLVGVSGISGQFVRPKWQVEPPKQPDLGVNWLAFGINQMTPDANSFIGVDSSNATITQRHEDLEIGCSIYGPEALDIADLIRDGFQIPQNLEALRSASMGFTNVGPARHLPDFVNERFINRIEMSIYFRREIHRTYPILTLLSAHGTVHSVVGDEQYLLDWETQT